MNNLEIIICGWIYKKYRYASFTECEKGFHVYFYKLNAFTCLIDESQCMVYINGLYIFDFRDPLFFDKLSKHCDERHKQLSEIVRIDMIGCVFAVLSLLSWIILFSLSQIFSF